MSNELTHYGVLGMKWGKRKKVETSNKQRSVNTQTDSFVLKKGSTIHRTIYDKNQNLRDHMYATFKAKDAYGYLKRQTMLMPSKSFDMTMKAKHDLISPSKQERVKTFVDMMMKDDKFAKEFVRVKAKNYSIIKKEKDIEKLRGSIKKIEKSYNTFRLAIAGDNDLMRQYTKELSKKGYNMMLDDNDAKIVSNSPIVIFNSKKSIEVIKISPATKDYLRMLKEAQDAKVYKSK